MTIFRNILVGLASIFGVVGALFGTLYAEKFLLWNNVIDHKDRSFEFDTWSASVGTPFGIFVVCMLAWAVGDTLIGKWNDR